MSRRARGGARGRRSRDRARGRRRRPRPVRSRRRASTRWPRRARSGCWCPPSTAEPAAACRARRGVRGRRRRLRVDRHGLPDARRHRRDGRGRRRRARDELPRADGQRRGARHAGLQRARHRRALLRARAARRSATTTAACASAGRKSFVTSGGHADVMLVLVQSATARASTATRSSGRATASRFEGAWEGLGMAGNSSVAVTFDDVAVDDAARIGAAGTGGRPRVRRRRPDVPRRPRRGQRRHRRRRRSDRRDRARRRRAATPTATALAELPTIQHRSPSMDIETRRPRALVVRDAAALGDAGDPAALVALMEAKVVAHRRRPARDPARARGRAAARATRRRCRSSATCATRAPGAVMAPTNGVLRTWIGKALAGLPVP